jgi:anti-sigma regulatory factor (Ser/Thr protein kinase)
MVDVFNEAITADSDLITLDASQVYWVSPFTACWFAAIKDKLNMAKKELHVIPPERDNALHQWVDLGIGQYLGIGSTARSMRHLPAFIVSRLNEPSYPLASEVTKLLTANLKGGEGFGKALHFAIREVVDNAFEHGGVNHCYLAAYSVPNKHIVRLCILDTGIGIPNSLRHNVEFSSGYDDLDLVERAMRKGVSGKSAGRGIGLYLLADTVTRNEGASFGILSGNARVEIMKDQTRKQPSAKFNGTIVKLRLRTRQHFNFISVRDWESL